MHWRMQARVRFPVVEFVVDLPDLHVLRRDKVVNLNVFCRVEGIRSISNCVQNLVFSHLMVVVMGRFPSMQMAVVKESLV